MNIFKQKSDYFLKSLLHALGVFGYVMGIVLFLNNIEKVFKAVPEIFAAMFMLLLFVISATITGLLVLGKPIALFLNGEKRDAAHMLFYTIGWLIICLAGVASIIVIY